MKKTAFIKLTALVLALIMLLSLFACDSGEKETESATESATESTTETESVTETATETATETVGESDTVSETVSETVTETTSETVSDTESETDTETESETRDPNAPLCNYVHDYAAKEDGHWKPACEHCGKGEGKVQKHEYGEFVEDEGDLLYYSYVCTICQYEAYAQEVPYEINLFYPASEISNSSASGTIQAEYRFVSGIGYGEFLRSEDDEGANANITIEDSGSLEDDPVGQYMAVRLRLPRSQTGISLQLKSVHSGSGFTYKINGLKSGWITLALDLSKFTKANEQYGTMGYVADPYGEYYLERLIFTSYIGSGESLDIAYVLFCEEKDDLMSFIGNDSNCYYYEDVLTKNPEKLNFVECVHDYKVDEEKGTHTLENPCYICGTNAVYNEAHSYIEIIGGGKNSYECSVCGYAKYLKLVPESVNKYVSASELNAGGIIYYPYTKFNHGLYIEPGDAYTRYEGPTGLNGANYFNVGQVIFARDDNDVNPDNNGDAENGIRINVGDANYMVVRVRVNTDGLNPLKITISTTEFNKTLKDDGSIGAWGTFNFQIPVAQSPKDTWQVYVIDLAKVFPDKYIPNADGDYVLDTFYFNICEGNFAPGCTLDLSYMAYCSSWEEVAAIVDEEQLFYLSDAVGGGNWAISETRKCVGECQLGAAEITENTVAGTVTYAFNCAVCGTPVTSKTIDQTVTRYYYAGEIASTAKTYFQINGMSGGKGGQVIYDKEAGTVYSRYTGYEKKVVTKEAETDVAGNVISPEEFTMTPQTAQVLWQRAQEDMWAGQTSTSAEHYTESVGNAEWLVIRARTNNTAQNFTFYISTTEYDAADGKADGNTTGGMLGIAIPLSASKSDEWTTYVMNLKNVFGDKYEKDSETGEYVIDSFYFSFSSFAASTNIDMEYVSFVDGSWAELDRLIDEETVVVISDRSGGYGYAAVATGTCVGGHAYGSSSMTDAEGNIVNKIACAVCGDIKLNQTVSKDVNKFFDINQIGCFYQVHATDPLSTHSDAKVSSMSIDTESGVAFVRVSATFGATHINLNGGNAGGALSGYTINTGRYAVIKLRSSGNRTLTFDAQTGDHTEHTNTTFAKDESLAGKWMVWVIDLSTFTSVEGGKGYTCNTEQTIKFRITTGGAVRGEDQWYTNDPYYVDFAYFAIVDSVDEARGMITDETFMLFANGLNNPSAEKDTATGACAEHIATLEQIVENKEDGVVVSKTYNYLCGGCENYVVFSKTIPTSVGEYLAGATLANNVKVSFQITNKGSQLVNNESFVRFEGQGKPCQILWVRSQDDFTGDCGIEENGERYDIGNSTKIVIKVRSNIDLPYLNLSVSTEGRNKDADNKVNGYTSIMLQDRSPDVEQVINMTKDEWTVFVIDMAEIAPDYWKKAEGADSYVVDTLYFTPTSLLQAGQYIDVAYIAFAETWAEVDAIVDEAEALQILSTTGLDVQTVNVADGSVVTE